MSMPKTGNPLSSSRVAGPGTGEGRAGTSDAAPERNARKVKMNRSHFSDTDRHGHDVDDGIGGADFVEVNFVDGDAVDFCFGLRQAGKDFEAGFFDSAVSLLRLISRESVSRNAAIRSRQMTWNCVARIE